LRAPSWFRAVNPLLQSCPTAPIRIRWPAATLPGTPNVIGSSKLTGHNPDHWFNETAYAVPTSGTFGNEGRNSLTGPAFSRVNLSLSKTFAIWEQVRLQVRADANNAFNHPSFGLPNNSLTLSDGAISSGTSTIRTLSDPGRTMQLSARFSF